VPADSTAALVARLESPLPAALPVGRATALFCSGVVFHRPAEVTGLELVIDGVRHRPGAWRMPRPDVMAEFGGDLAAFRSGFWTTVPIAARDRPGEVVIEAAVRVAGSAEAVVPLARVPVVEADPPSRHAGLAHVTAGGVIGIAMTTYEPDPDLLAIQLDSLRSQADRGWVCVISDDHSTPETYAGIEAAVGGDPRFAISRAPRRLGFYRNFERALSLLPAEAELVALCDQDDRWYPEKLSELRAALGSAQLAYCDQRLVDRDGRVLAPTLWGARRSNHTNLASLLIANTITGAGSLLRREVAEAALPFPDTPGLQFHDHWIGLVALSMGDVLFVDRPLYDYVQHAGAVFSAVAADRDRPPRWSLPRPRRGVMERWRAAYFYGFLGREVQAQVLLARCADRLTARKRRALRRYGSSERSALGLAWLLARPLRSLAGRNETLGTEWELAPGVLWRRVVALRARVPWRPGTADARFPGAGPETFEQRRLRRWRARV
jgi:glycosyltransferase involved in cell wall biosynthesis